jgi:hypothetical protein
MPAGAERRKYRSGMSSIARRYPGILPESHVSDMVLEESMASHAQPVASVDTLASA